MKKTLFWVLAIPVLAGSVAFAWLATQQAGVLGVARPSTYESPFRYTYSMNSSYDYEHITYPDKDYVRLFPEKVTPDFSDVVLVSKKDGSVQFTYAPDGYHYNVVVLYNCRPRDASLEIVRRANESIERAEARYKPSPMRQYGEYELTNLYGRRVQFHFACLTTEHSASDYLVMSPSVLNGKTTSNWINDRYIETFADKTIDTGHYQHHALVFDETGKVILFTRHPDEIWKTLADINSFTGRPKATLNRTFFWFGNVKPESLMAFDEKMQYVLGPEIDQFVRESLRNLSDARIKSVQQYNEAMGAYESLK